MIVADECVPDPIVDGLRAAGFQVVAIAEEAPSIDDQEVLRRAVTADALLITADKAFGTPVFRQHLVSSGVLLLRFPPSMPLEEQAGRVVCLLQDEGIPRLKRSFAVVTADLVRLRPHTVQTSE